MHRVSLKIRKLFEAGKTYRAEAVPTKVVSTVGAGDSFGASFITQNLHK